MNKILKPGDITTLHICVRDRNRNDFYIMYSRPCEKYKTDQECIDCLGEVKTKVGVIESKKVIKIAQGKPDKSREVITCKACVHYSKSSSIMGVCDIDDTEVSYFKRSCVFCE